MYLLRLLVVLVIPSTSLFAAETVQIDIKGTITNEKNHPVAGATVRLKDHRGIFSVTNNAGAYALKGEIAESRHDVKPYQQSLWSIRGNTLIFSLPPDIKAQVQLFSTQGRKHSDILSEKLGAKTHRIVLPQLPCQLRIVRIDVGNNLRPSLAMVSPDVFYLHSAIQTSFAASLSKSSSSSDWLMVSHPYYDTSYTLLSSYTATIDDTLRYRRLNESEYIRVLVPNGGEVYDYGTLLTVAWLQKITISPEAVVAIGVNTMGYSCDIPLGRNEWNLYPRDYETPSPKKSYILTDSIAGEAIGLFTIALKDTSTLVCPHLVFAGDTNWVAVWDPYPEPYTRKELSDQSDGFYTVVGRP